MHAFYDAIYLSPHLDDAALSCGGQIYEQTVGGQTVLIVTVMAGSPDPSAHSDYIASLHARWALGQDAAAQRRDEDIAACTILGADYLHLDVPDCIYRFHPEQGTPLYLSDDDIFGDIHPAEHALFDGLVAVLAVLPHRDRVYAPLAIGHHVDHLFVRAAAEQLHGRRLVFYEDYPYAQKPGMLERVIGGEAGTWHDEVVAVGEQARRVKFDAIAAFRSQLSTFFQDRADLERQVGDYLRHVGGERVWRRGKGAMHLCAAAR